MISWLRETDGLDFVEAVRQLSELADLPMPANNRELDAADRQRKATVDACEAATGFLSRSCEQRGFDRDAVYSATRLIG